MTNLPETAIAAAKDAFARVYNDPATMTACVGAAIEAAAPHIAAAERDRIEGLFGEWVGILMSEPNSHPPEAWRSGFADLIRASDAEA